MIERDEFVLLITQWLEAAGIQYAICGAVAAGFHGHPRATMDVDILIVASPAQLNEFLNRVGADYYVSREAAHDALSRRSMFNVIDTSSGWKADLIVLADTAYAAEEFRRRLRIKLPWGEVVVQSAEDVILSKLDWARESRSERQLEDAAKVAASRRGSLDLAYLEKWAKELDVEATLRRVLADSEKLSAEGGS